MELGSKVIIVHVAHSCISKGVLAVLYSHCMVKTEVGVSCWGSWCCDKLKSRRGGGSLVHHTLKLILRYSGTVSG